MSSFLAETLHYPKGLGDGTPGKIDGCTGNAGAACWVGCGGKPGCVGNAGEKGACCVNCCAGCEGKVAGVCCVGKAEGGGCACVNELTAKPWACGWAENWPNCCV